MTSNLISNPGSGGYTFSSDLDGSGVQWPYSKLAFGAVGTQTVVTSSAALPVQEASSITEVDASQTVGTSAVSAISAGSATKWVNIQNVSQTGQVVGYTFDGSTPVIGNAGTFLLTPYGSMIYNNRIPSAALKVIGSSASTPVTIKYA